MEQKTKQYFIIDFDNTFIKSEGLEELAAIALKNNPQKETILEKIKELTTLGKEGEISFEESLNKRLELLKANRQDVEKLAAVEEDSHPCCGTLRHFVLTRYRLL